MAGLGEFRVVPGRPGLVVGVPHGTYDEGSDPIGILAGRLTGAGVVVATGFCGPRTGGVRLNVNRPTEGAGQGCEQVTPRARAAHAAYVTRVRTVAAGPLAAYVEVHGNRHPRATARVEVATAGVDRPLARHLARAAADALSGLQRAVGAGLELAVEPEAVLWLRASAARRWPPFAEARQVLHVEFPRLARHTPEAREAAARLVAALVRSLVAAGVLDGPVVGRCLRAVAPDGAAVGCSRGSP